MIDPQTLSLFQDAVADPRFAAAVGYCRLVRPGARIFRLRLGADLHAADLGGVQPAPGRADAAADRHDLRPAVRPAGDAAVQLARSEPRLRSPAPWRCRSARWRCCWSIRCGCAGSSRCWCWSRWRRWPPAGAITAARRSPPRSASARWPDSAAAPCRSASPPLLVFWLGGDNNAVTVRANIMVYFIMQGALSMVMYFFSGLFSAQAIVLSCCWDCRSRSPWPAARSGFTAPATRSTAAPPI